jgi:hypothetical protein
MIGMDLEIAADHLETFGAVTYRIFPTKAFVRGKGETPFTGS